MTVFCLLIWLDSWLFLRVLQIHKVKKTDKTYKRWICSFIFSRF